MKGKTDVKTVVAFLMAILIFSTPLLMWAQQAEMGNVMMEARVAAEKDAQTDTNSSLWFIAGCLGGVLGVIIAYVYEPSIRSSRLLGKSPEYVSFYTDFYKEKAKSVQSKQALTGCIVGSVISVLAYVALIAAAVEDSYYY